MPALQPPSMQIGALPPGFGPLPSTGPNPVVGSSFGTAPIVQQVAGASTTAAPASFSLTIAGTQVNSTLIAGVAVAGNGTASVITMPANWQALAGSVAENAANTLAVGLYFLPGQFDPGSVTSVLATVTNANGIAVWVAEFSGNWLPSPYPVSNSAGNYSAGVFAGGSAGVTNSSAAPTGVTIQPQASPVMLWGIEADVTGQAWTAANLGGVWNTGAIATSTTGATLVVIRPYFQIAAPLQANITYQVKGTLAGAIANGVATALLPMALSDSLIQPFPQSEPGSGAQIGGWGPLGPTKPGGAGGGY